MGKITILLSDEAEEDLRQIAKNTKRSISKQVEYLIEQYQISVDKNTEEEDSNE